MAFHETTEGNEITVNSLKTYRRLFVSLECHMQLKYGWGGGVKKRQKITDEIQKGVCKKVLLILRSSVNDATDWELVRESRTD